MISWILDQTEISQVFSLVRLSFLLVTHGKAWFILQEKSECIKVGS